MKTYEEKSKNVFYRIEAEKEYRNKRNKKITKIVTPALCLCCAMAIGIGLYKDGLFSQHQVQPGNNVIIADKQATSTISNSTDLHIIRADDTDYASDEGFTKWNNSDVSYPLFEALESGNKTDVFAILAQPKIDYTFEYEGKTLEDYHSAMWEEQNLPGILEVLLKEGESLKYREALYTTGTPSGERWSKALYEERVENYGNEILEKYIVDGRFLKEDVERDMKIAAKNTQATDAYYKALTAYFKQLAASVQGVLPSEVLTPPESFGIIIYFTKDGFSDFVTDSDDTIDTTDWVFGLTSKNGIPVDLADE